MAMSNFNSAGVAIAEDDAFYGRWYVDGKDYVHLVKIDFVHEGDFIEQGDWTMIHENTYPNYINKLGDTLYFLDLGPDSQCVAKVDVDGQNYAVLAEDGNDFMSVHNDRIYFCDTDYNYCSIDMNGGDRQTVLEGEIYDPYFLTDEWFIYRDLEDGESLHLYNIANGLNETVYAGKTSPAILSGNNLYFGIADPDTEGAYHLSKMDLTAITVGDDGVPVFPEPEQSEQLFGGRFSISRDGYIYGRTTGDGYSDGTWKDFYDRSYEEGPAAQYVYFGNDVEMKDEYNSDGLITAMYVYNTATGGGNSFGLLK